MLVTNLVQNIDLAPTIAEIANISPPATIDGTSLLPLLLNDVPEWHDSILLEVFWGKKTDANTPVAAIRTVQWKYVEYASGEKELYDLVNDHYEVDNLALEERYSTLIDELKQKMNSLLAQ